MQPLMCLSSQKDASEYPTCLTCLKEHYSLPFSLLWKGSFTESQGLGILAGTCVPPLCQSPPWSTSPLLPHNRPKPDMETSQLAHSAS